MNRSFISVIAGGFGADAAASGGGSKEQRPWKPGSADDAAFLMSQAENVIIVPGYGMAVAQAQHALREMADQLKKVGAKDRKSVVQGQSVSVRIDIGGTRTIQQKKQNQPHT